MAETFAQRRQSVVQSLRRLRQAYRKADSAGEILERELDRLINRRTIITPASLVKATQVFEIWVRATNSVEQPLADLLRVSQSYV